MAKPDLRVVAEPGEAGGDAPRKLTIEELARRSGMSVRNVREHQAKGLLPPPEVLARIGYYGPEHLTRLQLIAELRAEGFNLRGIKRLLEDTNGAAENLLGLKRAISEPFETEQPQAFTREELSERFGGEVGPRTLAEAKRLGVLVSLGGGRYEAPSPSLLDAAEEVMRRGVSLRSALSVVADVQRSCESISRRFVRLFREDVWGPFERDGFPEERWHEILEAIDRLRPIASQVVVAVFRQTMSRAVEADFGKEIERRARGRR
jgi:DNA-binding transcriptional MerR regulator